MFLSACRDQAERDHRREQGLELGPSAVDPNRPENDANDQGSTNLFVGNLAPDVDESMLLREFGRFGPIGTVKVMWPRDDEQRRRGRNTGFVAFMRREDAEKAKEALDGIILRDLELTLGWGKSVPLPAVPLWPPPGGLAAGTEDGAIGIPLAAAPEASRQRMHDGPPPKPIIVGRGPDIEVAIPSESRQRFLIDAMAFYVMRDGCEFEQVVMERESDNPEFAFLFDVKCSEHAYYRWRLFSLASGDSLRSWRVDPFIMVERSNRWIPPPMTLVAAAEKTAAQRSEKREDAPLSDIARDKLVHALRTLTVDRQVISDAMVFILDHADCAADVAVMMVDALSLSETPVPLKIARLFLVSDVLYNTSAPVRNASRYRARLQEALPDVFESLQESYRNADSRMAQELLRKHVLKVLRVWRGWYIFSDDFLNGLQSTFLRGGTGPAGTRTAASEIGMDVDPVLAESLAAMTDDELEVRCKHCGLSRRGGREAQVARLLALDTYLNGGKNVSKSKLEQADTTMVPEASAGGWEPAIVESRLPTGGVLPSNPEEDERKKRLRQAEVAALELKEQLEEQGIAAEEIERQVAEKRAEILAENDESAKKRQKIR